MTLAIASAVPKHEMYEFNILLFYRPCDYCPEYKKREMKFIYSFSGKKRLKCAVEV